ncbi:MAG: hypothetical protein A3K03_03945 [Bdellovibrionales bacterium RIFOXYD1_FULL_44_7]|nr:MAG: hypothetical protein A3K03_03945 [Bdellovibrionales bacterium RIFOXYD1_FULL_44_7]
MYTWVIISWVFVLLLTAVNVFVFIKLKSASDQMLKMAFPGAKNMSEALRQMQMQMQNMQSRGGRGAPAGQGKNMDAQLRTAMDMLKNMNKGGKR